MKRWSWMLLFALSGCTRWDDLVAARLCVDGGLRPACDREGISDAGISDAGTADAGTVDAGTVDAGIADAGIADAGIDDAGIDDAGIDDAGIGDAGIDDAGIDDAGTRDGGIDAGPDTSCESDAGGHVDWSLRAPSGGYWDIKASRSGLFVLEPRSEVLADGGAVRHLLQFAADGGLLQRHAISVEMSATSMLQFDVDARRFVVLADQALGQGQSLTWLVDGGLVQTSIMRTGATAQRVALRPDAGAWVVERTTAGPSLFSIATDGAVDDFAMNVVVNDELLDLATDRQGRAVMVFRNSTITPALRVVSVEANGRRETLELDAGTQGGAATGGLTSLSSPRADWLSVVDEARAQVWLGPRTSTQFTPVALLTTQFGRPMVRLATCEGTTDVFAAVSFGSPLQLNGMTFEGDGGFGQLLAARLQVDGDLVWAKVLPVDGRADLFGLALDCGRLFISGNCSGNVDAGLCTGETAGTGNPFILSVMP